MNKERKLRIYFVDGNKLEFAFTPTFDPNTLGDVIGNLMNQTNIVLEAEGRLFLIPTANIKYIDITPAPEKLGSKIIQKAKLVV